jgi:hypothetical protein
VEDNLEKWKVHQGLQCQTKNKIVSVMVRKNSYEYTSNSEYLPRESGLKLAFDFLRFFIVGLGKWRSLQKKGGYTRRTALSDC